MNVKLNQVGEQEPYKKWQIKLNSKEIKVEGMMSSHLEKIRLFSQELSTKSPNISKKHILYMDLYERYDYLQNLEKQIISVSREKFENYIPFMGSPAGFEFILSHLESFYGIGAYNLLEYAKQSRQDIKAMEHKTFMKYGLNLQELAEEYKKKKTEFSKAFKDIVDEIGKESGIIGSGIRGEKRVKEELDVFNDVLSCLYNIRLDMENTSIETDAVIISSNGVFSIEVKNYGESENYFLKITRDGQWLKVYYDDNEEPMENVTSQVNRHIGLMQRFLNNKMKENLGQETPYIFIEPIFVIANENVRIENESDLVIIRPSKIYHQIKAKQVCIPEKYVNDIAQILKSNSLPSKKYQYRDYCSEIADLFDDYMDFFIFYVKVGYMHQYFMDLLHQEGIIIENYWQSFTHSSIPIHLAKKSVLPEELKEIFNDCDESMALKLEEFLNN